MTALTRNEQAQQAQMDTREKAYRVALCQKPRNEAECLRLAQEMLVFYQGTRLEASARNRITRHQGK